MVTLTTTTKVPQSIEEPSQSYNDEQHSTSVLADDRHHQTIDESKPLVFNDDENLSINSKEQEYYNNYYRHHPNQATWPQVVEKRYANKLARARSSGISGSDSRLWAIPYRFGKRAAAAAMPYRFGKRAAAMHFRLGKKNAAL
ncbi:unnamed protein product [Adineta steineri]|uniref:Uncharacterized protein n=1 Tax=Adineta steineri TaxID=433720 RepID=A0A819EUH6_9BILA|nr:unnamed protein product [Adineta steineri]CAF3855228.1 unnamed protein product [Adineta steineri]